MSKDGVEAAGAKDGARDATYLSGRDAADFLGVKRETLYAYASRGLVRSEPGIGSRARRYRRDDLERLKARHDARSGHGPVAAGALRWGEPVLASAITELTAEGPRYRGQLAVRLAAESSFEAVSELLWTGALPAHPPSPTPTKAGVLALPLDALAALAGPAAHPVTVLSLAVAALGAVAPVADDEPREAVLERARDFVRTMACLIGFATDRQSVARALAEPTAARAILAAFGRSIDPRAERLVEAALILSADHELNPSTFAVRVAASVRADFHACAAAGLATLSGTKHGASCDRVEAFLRSARPDDAQALVRDRAALGKPLPGFGHPVYPDGDPRAPPLLSLALAIAPENPMVRAAIALVGAAAEAGGEAPNIDLGLAAASAALGLPARAATGLFAVGRTAGWIAHALEQREAGFVLRPRARYTGA